MIEIQRILCPIDFSDFSRRAFDHAVAIAKWYESTITLLNVHAVVPPADTLWGAAFTPPALTPEGREALLTAMRQFAGTEAAANVPIEFEIAEGLPTAEITGKAESMPADLLVMGTHGRSGFERLTLGSVTEKVVRTVACPVLTVPGGAPDVAPAPVVFKKIVCAVDFSDASTHALNYAMSLAQEADAHLTLVHVIELSVDVAREVHENVLGPRNLQDYIASTEASSRVRLEEAVPESVRAYCTVDTELPTGKPYREILRVAAERQADLLVIGIHGRGVVDRMFFGSTAQHLVRQAPCPVLTLRRE